MKRKRKEKNPFVGYTLEETRQAEKSLYVIQMGDELFVHEKGHVSFSKDEADKLFEILTAGLQDMLKNGNFEDREDARKTFASFRIMPLRFN